MPRNDPGRAAAGSFVVVAALAAIVALAAALRFADFGAVPTTPFYDAAVRSMGLSWHNFFYGALDPSGQLAADKPPVDLWLQLASTKLLGFSSVALRLPPAIAGLLAVPLTYDLVRRGFDRLTGLAAALALAVLPATVLTSRSDTMDVVMALLLLLAAWLVVRAAPERRPRAVVAAGAVAGLAFEVKLTEAMVALPAFVVLAWLALDAPRYRKLRTLAIAGGAYVAVAASWAIAASLLPGPHPYAYGSGDGTIWNMMLVYNGVDRLGNPPTAATAPGLFRLFDPSPPRHFGQLLGAELLCALVAGALATAFARGSRLVGPVIDDRRRLRRALGWGLGTWLVVGTLVASFMGRQWPRYLEAFAPAVAGVLGVGIVSLATAAGRRRRALMALLACAVVSGVAGLATGGSARATALAGALAAAAALPLAIAAMRPAQRRALAGTGAALVFAAALTVPIATSVSLVRADAGDGETTGTMPPAQLDRLSAYLRGHQGNARYETAGATIFDNVALIVKDARPVLTLMNEGNRPLVTPAQLARAARAGAVRYVLIGSPSCLRRGIETCPPVVRWARSRGTDVSLRAGLPDRGILYRLPSAR